MLTLDGAPIADACIELRPPSNAPRYRVREERSGADGRFLFAGLPEGTWQVTAVHAEWVLHRLSRVPTRVPTGAQVDLIATPGTPVSVQVEGPGAERARLQVFPGGRGEHGWADWSPDASTLLLGSGSYRLRACVDPLEDWPTDQGWMLAEMASDVAEFEVGKGEVEPILLELERKHSAFGEFTLPIGFQGFGRTEVQLVEHDSGTNEDFSRDGVRRRDARVDERGRFGLVDLDHRHWTGGVELGRGLQVGVQVVEVDGLTRVEFASAESDFEESVQVALTTPDGLPLLDRVGFRVVHRDSAEDKSAVMRRTVEQLQADGTFKVSLTPVTDKDDLLEQVNGKRERRLIVSRTGYVEADVDFPPGTDRLDVRLEPAARLIVRLTGPDSDRIVREGSLRGNRPEGHQRGWLYGSFDEDEHALIANGLSTGKWNLRVESDLTFGGDWRDETIWAEEIELGPGVTVLEIECPDRVEFSVRAPAAKSGTRVSMIGPLYDNPLRDEDVHWQNVRLYSELGEDHVARFGGVIPGDYRVYLGSAVQRVRVPGPELEFAGQVPERYRVRLTAGDSPSRKAGLRSGDVLLAMDGEARSPDEVNQRLNLLNTQNEGTAALTLQRDGSEVTVVLDSARLGEDEVFEVPLEPVLQ